MEARIVRIAKIAVWIWGCALAFWMAREFFLLPRDAFHETHEYHHYFYRLIEFRDLLAAGYWSPQWTTHFRGGLGMPYFSYYQPLVFYVGALVPWFVDATKAMGCVVFVTTLFGYGSTYRFIRSRYDGIGGVVGATALVLSPYAGAEIFVRGDLSEYLAMMIVPFVFHRFLNAVELGRNRDLAGLALGYAACAVAHPCTGFFAAVALGAAWVCFAVIVRDVRRMALVALGLGFGAALTAFYALPVAREWNLVLSERAYGTWLNYVHYFASFDDLAGAYDRGRALVPLTAGPGLEALLGLSAVLFALGFRELGASQKRFWALLAVTATVTLLLATPATEFVWQHWVTLQKTQFPWRSLSVATPALALGAGALPSLVFDWVGPELMGRIRAGFAVAAVIALAVLARPYTQPRERLITFKYVDRAKDMETAQYFHPDLVDERLPLGANFFPDGRGAPKTPSATGCSVEGFERDQGLLRFRVGATPGCEVVLPHLYFPVGWRATAGPQELGLKGNPDGLMVVQIPPTSGMAVEVRFHMTPARRWGWVITLAAAFIGAGLLVARRREALAAMQTGAALASPALDGAAAKGDAFAYVGSELELFEQAERWKAYFRGLVRPYVEGHVLEVGAGIGGTTRMLCDGTHPAWTCLEPDPKLAEAIRGKIRDGLLPACCSVVVGRLSELDGQGQFDTVLYVDVLEHIEDDRAELERVVRRIREGGHLVVVAPAYQWLYSAFDKSVGHFRRYTTGSMRRIIPAELVCRRLGYLDSVGMLASVGNRLLLRSPMPTRGQLAFWDRFLVPLSTGLDRRLRYSVGRSVLGVWQRPRRAAAPAVVAAPQPRVERASS